MWSNAWLTGDCSLCSVSLQPSSWFILMMTNHNQVVLVSKNKPDLYYRGVRTCKPSYKWILVNLEDAETSFKELYVLSAEQTYRGCCWKQQDSIQRGGIYQRERRKPRKQTGPGKLNINILSWRRKHTTNKAQQAATCSPTADRWQAFYLLSLT